MQSRFKGLNVLKMIMVLLFLIVGAQTLPAFACYIDTAYMSDFCGSSPNYEVKRVFCQNSNDERWGCIDPVLASDTSNPSTYCPSNACCFHVHGGAVADTKLCPMGNPVIPAEKARPNQNACSVGSVIRVDSFSMSEHIFLTGVPFPIVYSSEKVLGRKTWFKLVIPPVFPGTNSGKLYSEEFKIEVAGRVITGHQRFGTANNNAYTFFWDELDSNNQPVVGPVNLKLTITPIYINQGDGSHETGMPIITDLIVGTNLIKDLGFAGWDFSIRHQYDPLRKVLYLGDGSTMNASAIPRANGEYWIVSSDRNEIFVFDQYNKHIQTKNALTNAVALTFNYDTQNKLTSVVDAYGNTTSMQYSGSLPVSITSPYGHINQFTTDSNGYLASVTNPASEVYSMTYSSLGLLESFTKPSGRVSTKAYDTDGLLKNSSINGVIRYLGYSTSDPNIITEDTPLYRIINHEIEVSKINYRRYSTYPDGSTSAYQEDLTTQNYSSAMNSTIYAVTKIADPRFGTNQKMVYSTSLNNGGAYYRTYNSEVVSLSDPNDPFSFSSLTVNSIVNDNTFTSTFNPTTKLWSHITPAGRVSTTSIDEQGNLLSLQNASFTPVNVSYDLRGRIETISQGSNRTTQINYDTVSGLISSVQNPLNQTTSFTYDSANRMISQTFPDNRVVLFNYDSNDNLVSITPPGKPEHTFNYNNFELLTSYLPPMIQAPNVLSTTY